MTPEMADRLKQVVKSKPRNVTEADIIREAIRLYLDGQEDLIGSRRHFQRSFQDRIERLETTLAFQLNVLLFLMTQDETVLREAIILSRKHGDTLLAQMDAVRNLKDER